MNALVREKPLLPAPTLLDRLVGYFSPRAELERRAVRAMIGFGGAYKSTRGDRTVLQGWNPHYGSANADSLFDLPELRTQSRDLERTAPLAAGAINTTVTSVVGTGLLVQPQVDRGYLRLTEEAATIWEATVARLWYAWADTPACDVTRRQTFDGLTAIVLRSTLASGDILAIRRQLPRPGDLFGLRVQLIEADRVSNPNWQMDTDRLAGGVEVDQNGEPVRYHVLDRHPGETFYGYSAFRWTPVEAYGAETGERQVLHIFEQRRAGQSRGIPYLAPVIEPLKQLDRYTDYELMAAALSACFTVFVKTPIAEGGDAGSGLPSVVPTGGVNNPPATPGQIKLGGGTVVDLMPGEDIVSVDPKRPNDKFDPFVLAVIRQIGVALEIPFELMVKHFTASYSAARAALLEAWRAFYTRRSWLARSWCQPTYEWLVTEAVLRGYLQAPGFFDDPLARRAWLNATWTGPSAGQINPLDEVNAADKRIQLGVSSLEAETAFLTGGDWEAVHAQQVKERRIRIRDGLPVTPQLPVASTAAAVDAADQAQIPPPPAERAA
jgi:lambda family phage portal protein